MEFFLLKSVKFTDVCMAVSQGKFQPIQIVGTIIKFCMLFLIMISVSLGELLNARCK